MNRLRLQLMFLSSCLLVMLFLRDARFEELFKGWYEPEGPLEITFGKENGPYQLLDSIRIYYPVKAEKID